MMKRSLICTAVLSALTVPVQASFSIKMANTDNLNDSRWHCKRCTLKAPRSQLGVVVAVVDSDDNHVVNRVGTEEGVSVGVSGLVMLGRDNTVVRGHAEQLGFDTGHGRIGVTTENLSAKLAYSSMTRFDQEVTSYFGVNGQQLEQVPGGIELPLKLDRERVNLTVEHSADWAGLRMDTFANYDHSTKVGAKRDATRQLRSPLNYAKPVDYTTQGIKAGARLSGERWSTTLDYRGSLFENGNRGLFEPARDALKAYAPDNQLHQLSLEATYRWDETRLKGRLLRGWLSQDDTEFVELTGVPQGITHANGEVQTTQANLRLNSRVGDIRVNARYDYSDRDNRTLVVDYRQPYAIDQFNGRLRANTPLDITRHRYSLEGVGQFSHALMVEAGYRGKQTDRSYGEREETREDSVYTRVRWHASDNLDAALKLQFGSRDGSGYQASQLTSSESNPLLRKYHLADRERSELKLELGYLPMDALTVDLDLGYAKDDYGDSDLGQLQSEDVNYHLSLVYQVNANASLSLFGGQQWLENEQSGSQTYGMADWWFDGEDRLDYLGGGLTYRGLMADRLALGLDYEYSESQSDVELERAQPTLPYGDYFQWSHSVKAYAVFDWSAQDSVRLDYRYERYFDTDYSEVSAQSVAGLIALEQQGHNYVAHQVMLTYIHAF